MQRPQVIGALWISALGMVIGTAGLVGYDACDVGGGERAQHWAMTVVSALVVASAGFFTVRRPAALRFALASALALAVVGLLVFFARALWVGPCG